MRAMGTLVSKGEALRFAECAEDGADVLGFAVPVLTQERTIISRKDALLRAAVMREPGPLTPIFGKSGCPREVQAFRRPCGVWVTSMY